jgi:hypothetical protein
LNEDVIRNIVRDVVRQVLSESEVLRSGEAGPASYSAPWTGVEYEAHPSRRQFNIDEATTPISDLLEFPEARVCSIEKDKSCDHCGMCRSLGF